MPALNESVVEDAALAWLVPGVLLRRGRLRMPPRSPPGGSARQWEQSSGLDQLRMGGTGLLHGVVGRRGNGGRDVGCDARLAPSAVGACRSPSPDLSGCSGGGCCRRGPTSATSRRVQDGARPRDCSGPLGRSPGQGWRRQWRLTRTLRGLYTREGGVPPRALAAVARGAGGRSRAGEEETAGAGQGEPLP